WVLVPFVLVALSVRRRSKLPVIGLTWWLAGLMLILPLQVQKHLHYLYSPAVGFAVWLGSVAELLFQAWPWPSLKRVHAAWAAVILLVVGHAVLSEALIRRRYRERLADVDLAADAFVRTMEIG